ncbi:MAG: ABC transporter substrate-binding protein [Chloroflexi bacterium]|nr:ABC transporter substrate-binding protein [Chloroflexota bacterium]
MQKRTFSWMLILIAAAMLLAACQPTAAVNESGAAPASQPSAAAEEKEVIRFGDQQWDTLWINNAIAGFIIEHGYGYPVETVELTTPVALQSIETGDIDVIMELWRANIMEWYNRVTAEGIVVDLGNSFDVSTQGWYVPRYVIEGDAERGIEPLAPDLKTVYDLANYTEVFQDPEDPNKGVFVNAITGWQVAEVNRAKFKAYGLLDLYNFQEPGSSGALDAAIAGAYKKGEPVLAYYWEPTWLMGTYDMVLLEEPAYNDECWAEISQYVEGTISLDEVTETSGCAFETTGIHKGVNAGLIERAPEVAEFLHAMEIPTPLLNELAAYLASDDAIDADDTAVYFLQNHTDLWMEWVSEETAAAVQAALE